LQTAQELHPTSREIRSLQLEVSRELKSLKSAERQDRDGMLQTGMNHRQIFKQEKLTYAARLSLLRHLLPEPAAEDAGSEAPSRQRAEALLEQAAHVGWANLGREEQLVFGQLWSAAQPRLKAQVVRDGRDAGVFPPRDEEKIFGQNLPGALMSKPFPDQLAWLSPQQKQRARGLALVIWQRGAETLDNEERRLCEALGLLTISNPNCKWHTLLLGSGGAQLILSQARAHLWPFRPPTLRVVDAVMGASLSAPTVQRLNTSARRPLACGELGILKSYDKAWAEALEAGWGWSLVLEDDAVPLLDGGWLQLLALLPSLVESVALVDPEWRLISLAPVDSANFFAVCDPQDIPLLVGEAAPAWARRPTRIENTDWRRIGPTFHAFGWIYRAPLMQALVDAFDEGTPPLNPLDVWVWEVMASRDMLAHALAPSQPLIDARGGVQSAERGTGSVKAAQ